MKLLAALILSCALASANAAPAADKGRRHAISIENLKYKPAEITIEPGDTVVWTNNDDREHTVTADDDSFKSGRMGSGKKYEHTFDKAGTYKYVDDLHPRMKGTVIVKEKKK